MNLLWNPKYRSLFEQRSALNRKLFPPLQDRIFQGSYAGVIVRNADQSYSLTPMRYGVYEPEFIKDKKMAKAFNARSDNLAAAYWTDAFQKNHGFVVVSGFYEWVEVADLLKSGQISLAEIAQQFAKEIEERKARVFSDGKKYALTATEKKDPRLRKIVIKFSPSHHNEIYVPVVYTERILEDGEIDYGFAIVTGEPQPEILAAGHDRSPVFLTPDATLEWMNLEKRRSLREIQLLLTEKPVECFVHGF